MPSDLTAHPLETNSREGRSTATNAGEPWSAPTLTVGGRALDWRQAVGGGLVVIGVLAIIVGWFQISGTAEVWKQLPYVASGGIGGAALIAIGLTLIVAYEHANDRAAIARLLVRLDSFGDRSGGASFGNRPPEGGVEGDDRDRLLERLAALEAALAGIDQGSRRSTGRAKAAAGRAANGSRRA